MPDVVMSPALVTVLTYNPYGSVNLERFETEHMFRPMYINPNQVYSIETHREGFSIRDVCRSGPVDVATWLHRLGVWVAVPD